MSEVHIDRSVMDNCWNLYDSFGEICVECGCCSKDPLVRAKARYDTTLEHLVSMLAFDDWSDDKSIRTSQKKM